MSISINDLFDDSEISALVRRLELIPQLIRRQQEELILQKVPISSAWILEQRQIFLGELTLQDLLVQRGWPKVISIFIFARGIASFCYSVWPWIGRHFLLAWVQRPGHLFPFARRDGGLAREL